MFSTILVILVVIIAAVLVYAATRPNDFVVTRTANIKAPAEAIFPLINDFSRWPAWSPYEKLDPNMKRTLSGAPSGKGAAYAWESNGKAGKGRMEIVNSVPSSLVSLNLDFEKPFRANNSVDFTLAQSGENTAVIWAMRGNRPFIAKLMGLFMNFADRQGFRGRPRQFETRHRGMTSLGRRCLSERAASRSSFFSGSN